MRRLIVLVLGAALGAAGAPAITVAEAAPKTASKSASSKKAGSKKSAAKKSASKKSAGKKADASRTKKDGKKRRASAKRSATGRDRASSRGRDDDRAVSLRPALLTPIDRAISCPPDMVAVAGRVCVDRYETSIVDASSGAAWSPFYTPDRARATEVFAFYASLRSRAAPGSQDALTPLPPVPSFEVVPRARSVERVIPQGYLSADRAQLACEQAGKRLCSEAEWVTACRGEARRDYPYGDRYEQGVCNVFREDHPSSILHGNAARYHDDPRNGALVVAGRTLLLETGASERCASRWGDDAIFDMVGNLDEWVADDAGVFVGGFYSRGSRAGCFARVSAHPRRYSDYSTGARCCKDPDEERTP